MLKWDFMVFEMRDSPMISTQFGVSGGWRASRMVGSRPKRIELAVGWGPPRKKKKDRPIFWPVLDLRKDKASLLIERLFILFPLPTVARGKSSSDGRHGE